MTSLPQAKGFNWSNLGIRVASATVLVPTVLAAVWVDEPRWPFLVMIAVAVAVLAIEWGGMTAPKAPGRVSTAVTVAVLSAVFLAYSGATPMAWLRRGSIFVSSASNSASCGRPWSRRSRPACSADLAPCPPV